MKKKVVRIDAEAAEEIEHAIRRYDEEREGLGMEFFCELSDAIDKLDETGPACGPVIGLPAELGVRRKLLSRFPYGIVFIESDTVVRVISVMHGRRKPAYWRRRVGAP